MIARAKKVDLGVATGRKEKRGNVRKAISMAQLVFVVAGGVFLAGVVAPTLVHAMTANGHSGSGAPVHTLTVVGVTFLYTGKNLAFAFFGGLLGAIVAWAIEYPSILGKARVIAWLRRGCGLASSPARMQRDNLPTVRNWLKSAEQN